MKKTKLLKIVIYALLIFVISFSLVFFSLTYEQLNFFVQHRSVEDGTVVFYGKNDFDPFKNQTKEKPVMLVINKGFNLVIPKIGLIKELSGIDVVKNFKIPYKENKSNTLYQYNTDENSPISGGLVLNTKYNYFDFEPRAELLLHQVKKNDYLYISRNNKLYKYQVEKSGYRFKDVEFKEDIIVILGTGPFDIKIPYYVIAKIVD